MKHLIVTFTALLIAFTAYSQSCKWDSRVVWCTSKGQYLTAGHFESIRIFSEILAGRKWNESELDLLKREIRTTFIKNPAETLQLIKDINYRIGQWHQMAIISESELICSEMLTHDLALIKKDSCTRFVVSLISAYCNDFNLEKNDSIVMY